MKLETLEELPSYSSSREIRNQERDYRVEPIPYNKIVGFLHKHTGQHIDSVFSAFCKTDWIPAQYRTWEKFCFFVETNTFIKDKNIFYVARFWMAETSLEDENSKNFFYVHPVSRNLCHKPKTKVASWSQMQKLKQKENYRFISRGVQLLKFSGVWYQVEFSVNEKIVYYDYSSRNYQVRNLTEKDIDKLYNNPFDYSKRSSYANISKKQLSCKELKAHNLKNN